MITRTSKLRAVPSTLIMISAILLGSAHGWKNPAIADDPLLHKWPVSASDKNPETGELITADMSGELHVRMKDSLEVSSTLDSKLMKIAQLEFSKDHTLFAISGEGYGEKREFYEFIQVYDAASKKLVGEIRSPTYLAWGLDHSIYVWNINVRGKFQRYKVLKDKIDLAEEGECPLEEIDHILAIENGVIISGHNADNKYFLVSVANRKKSVLDKIEQKRATFTRTPSWLKAYATTGLAVHSLEGPEYQPKKLLQPSEGMERFVPLDDEHAIVCTKERLLLFDLKNKSVEKEADLFEPEKKAGGVMGFRVNRLLIPVGVHRAERENAFLYINMRGDFITRSTKNLSILGETRIAKGF